MHEFEDGRVFDSASVSSVPDPNIGSERRWRGRKANYQRVQTSTSVQRIV
jgi:hypothetical protein